MNQADLEHNHRNMVAALSLSGNAVLARLSPVQVDLLHMAVGISGEAGELLDAVKKSVYYNKPLDFENVREELGDLEFYMQGLRALLAITRESCLQANMDKLSKRYPNFVYSDQRAQERADKLD